MISIEDKLDNVLLWHFGELPGEDILQIQQVFQGLMILIIADHLKADLIILLLNFGSCISRGKP